MYLRLKQRQIPAVLFPSNGMDDDGITQPQTPDMKTLLIGLIALLSITTLTAGIPAALKKTSASTSNIEIITVDIPDNRPVSKAEELIQSLWTYSVIEAKKVPRHKIWTKP